MENQAVQHMYSFYHLMELKTGSIICGAQYKMKVGRGICSKKAKHQIVAFKMWC